MRMKTSPYFHDDIFFSSSGSPEEDDKILAYNEQGITYLKTVGVKPTYAKIQAALSECDLENVLKACVHNNQNTVPSVDFVNGLISDFSHIDSLGDLLNASKNMNSLWNDLPLEVRENFDSNIHKFTVSINTPDFNDKLVDGYNRFSANITQRLDGKGSFVDEPLNPNIDVNKSDTGGESNES